MNLPAPAIPVVPDMQGKQIDDLPTEEEMFRQVMLTAENAWRNNISRANVEQWLHNFKGRVFDIAYERRLALWLLCNFAFYNEREMRHLCRVALREYIHQMAPEIHPDAKAQITLATHQLLQATRFYHLGRAGESGSFLLYYFRQENRLGVDNFIWDRGSIPDKIRFVVYVDDVLLSGTQAKDYLTRPASHLSANVQTLVLSFFSTNEAESLLREAGIRVISCVKLDDRCKCFSSDSSAFADHLSHKEPCLMMATEYGKMIKSSIPLGYNNDGYAFGFFYNTPDNTLPLFWAETENWAPVMKRYDKLYGKGHQYDFGAFV